MYALDTNICIYLLKGSFPALRERFEMRSPSEIAVPSIVKAELLLGAYKSSKRDHTLKILDAFLAPLRILPFGDEDAIFYARTRSELEAKGAIIGPNDLLIAATVLAHGAILVTHNVTEFKRVNGLAWEDWTA